MYQFSENRCGSKKQLSCKKKVHESEGSMEEGSSQISLGTKIKRGKRPKRRKSYDSNKKLKKEDEGEYSLVGTCLKSTQSPDCEVHQLPNDSPVADETCDGSNTPQESNEMLCISTLLKSVLDRKKQLLLETGEIVQFFKDQYTKRRIFLKI